MKPSDGSIDQLIEEWKKRTERNKAKKNIQDGLPKDLPKPEKKRIVQLIDEAGETIR